MNIDRIVLREIKMQLKEPFEISSGVCYERRVILLTLFSDGLVAWSECVAGEDPGYSYETCETAWSILTQLILPQIIGKEIVSTPARMKTFDWIKGHPMAKAAVEMALLDLEAKAHNRPLSTFIGGENQKVKVGVSVGLQPNDDELANKVGAFIEKGYSRIKLKIKPSQTATREECVIFKVHSNTITRCLYPNFGILAAGSSIFLNAAITCRMQRQLDDSVLIQYQGIILII